MIQFNMRNRVAFISTCPPKQCPIAAFTSRLVETMSRASNGSFEPVILALQSDVSETYGAVDFVIRKDVRSDYMEAADLINAGNIDLVVLQHALGLFGGEGGRYIESLLRHLHVPVVTTLHTVPENPSPADFQSLVDICDASWRIIVTNRQGVDLLKKPYGIAGHKIELIPFDAAGENEREMTWSDIGWRYWQLAGEQLPQTVGKRRLTLSKVAGSPDFDGFQPYQEKRGSAATEQDTRSLVYAWL